MSERPMIEAHGLQKRYGEQLAVADVDIEVPRGQILGVLGPNGAGKSTTVRMLTTMTRPDGGTATIAGLGPDRRTAVLALAERLAAEAEESTEAAPEVTPSETAKPTPKRAPRPVSVLGLAAEQHRGDRLRLGAVRERTSEYTSYDVT